MSLSILSHNKNLNCREGVCGCLCRLMSPVGHTPGGPHFCKHNFGHSAVLGKRSLFMAGRGGGHEKEMFFTQYSIDHYGYVTTSAFISTCARTL